MAAQLSKEVTDHMRACLFVLSSFLTEGANVAGTLTGLTQPNLEEGDDDPGFSSVIVGLGRNVRAALERLVAADLKLSAAAGHESSLRNLHNERSNLLGFAIVALRRIVLGQYVEPDMENLGLQAVDVRDAITVSRRSELIGEQFGSPDLPRLLGEPRFQDPSDVGVYVRQVEEASAEVLDLVGQINEATRLTARARFDRDERMTEYKKLFLRSTRVFEDFCRLCDCDRLAEQVRATVARSRRIEPDPGDVVDSPDPGDAGGFPDPGDVGDGVSEPIDSQP